MTIDKSYLKKIIINNLEQQGFIIDENGLISTLHSYSKEQIRNLHKHDRNERLMKE